MPVMHYGPVPVFNASTWNLRVSGATESGRAALPGLGRVFRAAQA